MFWIQLYGKDQDGKMKVEPIRQPFFDLKVAIAKAKFIASKTTYHEGFRIINESKAVVREGCSLMPKGPKGEKRASTSALINACSRVPIALYR